MQGATSNDSIIGRLESAPLTSRFWATFVILALQFTFEYFDFFVVGYLVAVIGPQWQLTFGQSSIMLLSAGVGAIVGALVFGRLADVWGRKPLIVLGTIIYSVSAGAIALIPDDAWVLFSLLRFTVGLGLGAAATAQNAIVVEITPTRYRTMIGSAMNAPVAFGVFIAALSSATLLGTFGWRGLAALGTFPILIAILIAIFVPESIRWLVANNHVERARANLAWLLKVPASTIVAATSLPPLPPKASLAELYQERTKFWFTILIWVCIATAVNGILQWGPTIIALLMKIPPREAAKYFILMGISALILRIPFLFLAQWFGRRFCGMLVGYVVGICLIAAGIGHGAFIAGVPIFLIFLILAYAFTDAGFGNLGPYSAEIWPVRLAARGVGLAQAANGVGKILGPLCLAFIAGSSNVITPQATEAAAMPAFVFLGLCALVTGLAFTFVKIEPHGKPLELDADRNHIPASQDTRTAARSAEA
jgi:putative MFS transporter